MHGMLVQEAKKEMAGSFGGRKGRWGAF